MKYYRILVGMSGGVDSSVCALLLQRQGWEVQGLMLDLCSGGAGGSADDARAVAEHLGISFSVHDARAAQPLHRLQPPREIRPNAFRSGCAGVLAYRHRTLRTGGI